MNLEIYQDAIWVKQTSFFGSYDWEKETVDEVSKDSIVKAWLEDDDLQEMILTSSNIGIVMRYHKRYKP